MYNALVLLLSQTVVLYLYVFHMKVEGVMKISSWVLKKYY